MGGPLHRGEGREGGSRSIGWRSTGPRSTGPRSTGPRSTGPRSTGPRSRGRRDSTHLLDPVIVNVYGQRMPLGQVATVSTPDAKTISVQVWDRGQVSAVERAIREANLGLNPIIDGALIRLPIPALNAERRQELVKLAHKYAEHARVVVRNVRREGMELLKKLDRDGKIGKDEHHKSSGKVQELT